MYASYNLEFNFYIFAAVLLLEAPSPVQLSSSTFMTCPWQFMVSSDSTVDKKPSSMVMPPEPTKSFAQVLAGTISNANLLAQLPPKVIMGDSVRIRISKDAYESGLAACRTHLHGRLTLHKGDSPVTTQALKEKLNQQWPQLKNWGLIPLGKWFFEPRFNSIEDMRWIWALGAVNLKPRLLRFYRWTKDFAPQAQAQTQA